jgi:hypothetical protein
LFIHGGLLVIFKVPSVPDVGSHMLSILLQHGIGYHPHGLCFIDTPQQGRQDLAPVLGYKTTVQYCSWNEIVDIRDAWEPFEYRDLFTDRIQNLGTV